MIIISEEILKKHAIGLEAARKYYVLCQPTGFSDAYYDSLELSARQDGLELRDYVMQEVQGKRSQNADYIGKVEKSQVTGKMSDAFLWFIENERPDIKYIIPKYDGSSLAGYYDINTGKCIRVITIGGSNLGSEGIDQTEKFAKYFPNLSGTGICALQVECLVSLEHGFGESSRQKANGLVNAVYEPMTWDEFKNNSEKTRTTKEYEKYLSKFQENLNQVILEIDKYINLRCFRYFMAPGYQSPGTYKNVLEKLPKIYNNQGDCKFSGGFVFEKHELGDFVNSDIWKTPEGTFLVDGVVGYSEDGKCIRALKYKDAGRGEITTVREIKWNNQITKGKDSWSANAIIDPINVRGSEIKKPTVGSIKKMVERGLSKGAKVTVIMANSTIPQVSEVIEPGNLDYEWPKCSCGYKMSEKDIYGTLIKCGNPDCSERYSRMCDYLSKCNTWKDIDLNKLMVLDRFDWVKKTDYSGKLMPEILQIIYEDLGINKLFEYLKSYLTTNLQIKNLELVVTPVYKSLKKYVDSRFKK